MVLSVPKKWLILYSFLVCFARDTSSIGCFARPQKLIFERKKPLVTNTLRRIARGLDKFVIKEEKPFIIPIGYGERKGQKPRLQDIDKPLTTIVSS